MPISHRLQLKHYTFPFILLCSILLGAWVGYLMGPAASQLKPLGDIFLNLMFTVVVPLVFFTISSAIAAMGDLKRLWKVISTMMVTFLFTGVIAAIFMIVVV